MSDRIYVSLDLETTGLDLEKDRIIEIGALKFRGGEVLETFETLVNPGRPLPYRIKRLTGISNEELEAAPPFHAVAPRLIEFVSDHPIIGQNVSFDLHFLRAHGLTFPGSVYDMLDVANILLPQLPDYSLVTLAKNLDVPYPVHHRALADAEVVMAVFLALQEKASCLDLPLIAEIHRLTLNSEWPWRPFFADLEESKTRDISLWDRQAWEAGLLLGRKRIRSRKTLSAKTITKPLDSERVAAIVAENGPMSHVFPGFEFRSGQVTMLQAVTHALNGRHHLVVEAGTGIGKSVAYLLPAILFARQNNSPVIISTNTINLQEQLMSKDIPDLLRVLEHAGAEDTTDGLRVALLKGRSNYLCLRRWNTVRKNPGLSWEDTRSLLRLLLWVSDTDSGDRSEMNLSWTEMELWKKVCASEDGCVGERCPYHSQRCFLYSARQEAQGAHLVVVNHALLLADLTKNGGILPEYRCLVVDEAHHLEDEATGQLGYVVRSRDVLDYLGLFPDRGGFAWSLRRYFRSTPLGSTERGELNGNLLRLQGLAAGLARQAVEFFNRMVLFVRSQHPAEPGDYERHLRITREIRRQPDWAVIRSEWDGLNLELGQMEAALGELLALMESLLDREDSETIGHLADASSLRQEIIIIRRQLDGVLAKPESDIIYWVSVTAQSEIRLHAAPLDVGLILSEHLFSRKDSVILTSATLTVGGEFGYFKKSLGIEDSVNLAIEAPFDYLNSTMIYLPQDIPEPDKAGYQQAVSQALVDLCRATEGYTLALFTSHAALRAAYGVVQAPLEEDGILVMGQGIDGSPRKLLARFRENPRALLMGTAAFWEGVDVVGKALSVLVIVRLPFGVPTDPVSSARAEQFKDPFNEYNVPRAVLRFKQGFGRLIRSRGDRGAVVILDRRTQTKSYGRVFIDSLPPCTMRIGPVRHMPKTVLSWLTK